MFYSSQNENPETSQSPHVEDHSMNHTDTVTNESDFLLETNNSDALIPYATTEFDFDIKEKNQNGL